MPKKTPKKPAPRTSTIIHLNPNPQEQQYTKTIKKHYGIKSNTILIRMLLKKEYTNIITKEKQEEE